MFICEVGISLLVSFLAETCLCGTDTSIMYDQACSVHRLLYCDDVTKIKITFLCSGKGLQIQYVSFYHFM